MEVDVEDSGISMEIFSRVLIRSLVLMWLGGGYAASTLEIYTTAVVTRVQDRRLGGAKRKRREVVSIEEHARLRARVHACAHGVLAEGGARRCAQARSADVSTKLNLPFPGVNEVKRAFFGCTSPELELTQMCAQCALAACAQVNTARTCAQPKRARSSMVVRRN